MTHTQQDIDLLVKAANQVSYDPGIAEGNAQWLRQALRPFQPDPEEALIEKMAVAYCTAYYAHGGTHTDGARAALAVVKEHKEVLT